MTRAPRPGGPDPAGAAPAAPAALLRAVFGVIAARRPGGRAVHDPGAVFAAVLDVPEREWQCGVDGFDEPGQWPAMVRFSRGFGLPQPLPDVLGLAVRVESPRGPRDLLVDSVVGVGPLARRLGRPARRPLLSTYSSLLAYRLGPAAAVTLVLVLPVHRNSSVGPVGAARRQTRLDGVHDLGGQAFDVAVAGRGGGPVRLARLRLGERLPDGVEPHFDPTSAGVLVPAGPLGRLRVAGYPAVPVRA